MLKFPLKLLLLAWGCLKKKIKIPGKDFSNLGKTRRVMACCEAFRDYSLFSKGKMVSVSFGDRNGVNLFHFSFRQTKALLLAATYVEGLQVVCEVSGTNAAGLMVRSLS